jgi:hypothetical protein
MKLDGCPFALLVASALWTGNAATADEPGYPLAGAANAQSHPAADEHKRDEHETSGSGAEAHAEGERREEPSDLLLRDLFTTGWGEAFEERPRAGRAPRFNLPKSRQGFLERIAFINYTYTNGLEDDTLNEHELAGGLEWAFNRRFQLGIESFYTWQRPSAEEAHRGDGLRWDFSSRLQLLDTADCAQNFQIHVITPNSHLNAPQTELAFTLAGFEDLTNLGLRRVGLYHHIEYASLLGPRREEPDVIRPANLLRYDLSLAKTLIDPDVPLIGDFTVFFETFAETELDGSHSGRTQVTFTPGIRFNPTGREEKAWWVQTAIEFPVSGPRPFNERIFLEIIHDF